MYGDQSFGGKICGISIDWGNTPATIWIVECPELGRQERGALLDGNAAFTHVTIPQACLRFKGTV